MLYNIGSIKMDDINVKRTTHQLRHDKTKSPNINPNTNEPNIYEKVKFKDIFDTDTSASASASDTEGTKSNVGVVNKSCVSFSDLVVQERAKLRASVRYDTSVTKGEHNNLQNVDNNVTKSNVLPHGSNSVEFKSPKRVLIRSPSTIDALCGDSVSVLDEERDVSKAITTPTQYIRTSRKISLYPTYTRRLSDSGTVWVSNSCNNYVAFNRNHLYNKYRCNRKKLVKRTNNMKTNIPIVDKKSWGFENNVKLNDNSDLNRQKNKDNKNDLKACNSCNVYCSKIRTLEADLAVEKQHFEEMCKTNTELQQKLDETVESINQINKKHNHKLNLMESKIRQLSDRNMELVKRIELNINDIDYFKNCLLDSHNNLESLQTKLAALANENSDLLNSVDGYKTENEKLVKDCNYYKKQCKLLNDKLVQKSTIKLPNPQIWPTVTHTESINISDNIAQSATVDTFTDDVLNDNNIHKDEICAYKDEKIPNFVTMTGFEKGIFPSYIPSNSILTDVEEEEEYSNVCDISNKLCDIVEDINCQDVTNKTIVNRNVDTEYKPLELARIDSVNPSPKDADIPYNPTTKWILDRVSRPSNLESLFKLQDRLRDMSLRM